MINSKITAVLVALSLVLVLIAQETEANDLLLPETPAVYDSLGVTLKVELDSLSYRADSIYYDVKKEIITLSSRAEMRYQRSEIKAEEITIDLDNDIAGTKGETWMKDAEQVLYGDSVRYDFETQSGRINEGASRLDKGFYYGKEIRKVSDDIYDIDDGYFTTCDIVNPNYFIYSKKMRLFYKDRIVAKPVVFLVNYFPVMFIPYAAFSVKTERASGILVPEPGYNSVDGKTIENIALYYHYKDYAEVLTALDWKEKTGWEARLESNYIKRYFFNGNLLARYQNRILSSTNKSQEWYLRARHHNDFIDSSTLTANLEFMSSKTIWESSANIDERLNERITSSVVYRKPIFGSSLTAGANYTDNLTAETKQITLPTISYSLPSKPLFELFTPKGQTAVKDKWWHNFSYSYSLRGVHSGNITDPDASLADILYKNTKSPAGTYINQHNAGIAHNLGASFNYNLGGWLNLSQSVNGKEVWFDRDRDGKQFVRGNDYSANSRIAMSFYGFGSYPKLPLRAVRHIMTPSLSFNYTPDLSENTKYFSFSGIGLNSGKKQRRASFALDHKWSFKFFSPLTKSLQSFNDIFTVSSNVSYDLESDDKQFSNINHSASLRPGRMNLGKLNLNISTNGSAVQDAYKYDIINWRVSNSFSIGGESDYTDYFPQEKNKFFTGSAYQPDSLSWQREETENIINDLERLRRQKYPWDIAFNQDYSRVVKTKFTSHNLRSSLSFRLTQNWSVSYNNYMNLENKELISQSISIDRSLNCWKILFTFSKQGDYWNYRMQLYNVALPDVLRFRHSDHKR